MYFYRIKQTDCLFIFSYFVQQSKQNIKKNKTKIENLSDEQ